MFKIYICMNYAEVVQITNYATAEILALYCIQAWGPCPNKTLKSWRECNEVFQKLFVATRVWAIKKGWRRRRSVP